MSTYRSGKRVLIAVFVVLLVAGGAWASGKIEPTIPGLLVETSWLESRLDHDNLVIIDTGRSVDDYTSVTSPARSRPHEGSAFLVIKKYKLALLEGNI